MDYTISYFSEAVQEDILALPDTLAARYVVLSRRMVASFSARLLENALSCCTALSKSLTVPRYVSEKSPNLE